MIDLRALHRYTRRAEEKRSDGGCELCSALIEERHPHVVDLKRRVLCCACRACALLFAKPGAAEGRYRTVPDRVRIDPAFTLTESAWGRLEIPVSLAFLFMPSSSRRWVASYPSPAGAIESELPLDAFDAVFEESALARAVEPDVEALVTHGSRGSRILECFLVPIDRCYALAAAVRRHWIGFDGGDEARRQIEAFFGELRAKARPIGRGAMP